MPVSRENVLERATATRGVQAQIVTSWEWEELDLVQWDTKIAALRAAQDSEAATRAEHIARRATLDNLLDDLEERKVQGVGMARYRWRNSPTNLALVESLEELGSGREATISEARAWAKLWGEIEPTWSPVLPNTLAAFGTLLTQCVQAADAWESARLAWRRAATEWNVLAEEVEALCVAWYGMALRVFPEGTVEGDLIRSQIPTFPTSGPAEPPPTPTPPSP